MSGTGRRSDARDADAIWKAQAPATRPREGRHLVRRRGRPSRFLFRVAKSKRMIESRGEKQPEGGDSEPARNAVAGAEAHERAPAAASQECPRLPRSPTTSITRDNPAPVDALGRGLGRPAGSEGVMHRLASLEDPLLPRRLWSRRQAWGLPQ